MTLNKKIYFDYAANTPLDERVLSEMMPCLKHEYGNTTGIHQYAHQMQNILEQARENIAQSIGAKSGEIIFTGSATESNNTVLKGIAQGNYERGKHIITSQVEHPSVYEVCKYLEKSGFEITYLPVDSKGYIDPGDLKNALRKDTILVSLIFVNNELGTIEPIAEIGKICKEAGVCFHSDAAQGFGKLEIDVNNLGIDLLTASSHKIYGPLGAGMLYIRQGIKLEPLLQGGGQEFGIRSSTVNVPAVLGFSKAVSIYKNERKNERKRIIKMRQKIISAITAKIPDAKINGDPERGVSNILSISFKNTDGQLLAMQLDRKGIAVSTGSSCSSGKVETSRILKACKIDRRWIGGTIRISLGRFTNQDEVDYLINILPETVYEIRKVS